jgi:hypothetical protein
MSAGVAAEQAGSRPLAPGGTRLAEELTTFTVRIAATDDDLWKAVQVRHAAYARHLPDLAERLRNPEPFDYDETSAILLAESKLDGAALGTMRIQSNLARRLLIEQSVALPAWLCNASLAEATRLGVSQGRTGGVVKMMLFKAFYQFCLRGGVDWMVIGARPPLDRRYAALLFRDVLPHARLVPLRHAGNLPHRVMAFEIRTAEARWAEAGHPLYDFFCRTLHPDIDVRDVRRDFQRAALPVGGRARSQRV